MVLARYYPIVVCLIKNDVDDAGICGILVGLEDITDEQIGWLAWHAVVSPSSHAKSLGVVHTLQNRVLSDVQIQDAVLQAALTFWSDIEAQWLACELIERCDERGRMTDPRIGYFLAEVKCSCDDPRIRLKAHKLL